MADIDRGMEVADMKRLLTKSKVEPVNVAVGLDGKNAVMMLHKIKQPKAVSKDLEGKFKGLKNPRWGTAFVDTDADAKLVILTLNRAASGMGQKLKKTLKGTGFSKVRIQLEDGTVDEDVGEEDEEESESDAAGQPQNDQQPEAVAAQGGNDPQQPEPVAAQGPSQENEQQEGQTEQQSNWQAELMQQLADQVKRVKSVLQASPERGNELKNLAGQAQAALKGGDEQAARAALDALENALTNSPSQPDGGGTQQANTQQTGEASPQIDTANQQNEPQANGKNAAVLQKSRLAWVAARKRVEDEIGKLHDAMSKHYDGHGFGADLDKVFQSKVEPILTTLDQSLADKLDELGNSDDASQHQKLAGEARQIIDRYESFVGSNNLISQLDQNPFVPLQIQKTLTATLAALKKSVR